jgi:hypothetical protein
MKPDIYNVSPLLPHTVDTAGVLCEVIADTKRKRRPQSNTFCFLTVYHISAFMGYDLWSILTLWHLNFTFKF